MLRMWLHDAIPLFFTLRRAEHFSMLLFGSRHYFNPSPRMLRLIKDF